MAGDIIAEILQSMQEGSEDARVYAAEDEAGLGPRDRGELQPMPGRRFGSLSGWGEAASGAAQAGGRRFVEELTSPLTEIPEGIQRGAEALQNPDLTVLERLREVGMGGLHAGLSVGRAAFSPVSAVAKAGVELPVRLAEREGTDESQRPESVKLAMDIAEMLGGAVAGAKGVTKISDILKARRAKGLPPPGGAVAPPVEPPPPGPTSPVLDRFRQMEPEVAPMRQLPERTYSGGQPLRYDPVTGQPIPQGPFTPNRVFEVGPPKSVTGKPSVAYDPALRDIETGRIGKGAGPKEPTVFGKRSDIDVAGAADEGKSVLETMRARAKAALDQAPRIVDDIVASASKGPALDEVIGAGNVSKLSLGSRVKLSATDETKKLAHAISGASDDDLASAPSHIRDAVMASRPEDAINRPTWLGKAFTDLSQRLKMKFGINSMTQIAKNDPLMTELVEKLNNATVAQHALEESRVIDLSAIAKVLGGRDKIDDLARRIDRGLPLSPNQGQAATMFRQLFDKDATSLSLEPGHPLYVENYVNRIRNVVKMEKTRLVSTDEWVSTDTLKHFPTHFRPKFTEARKIELPGDKYDFESLAARLRAGARASVWGTPTHHGVLKDIEPILLKMRDKPEAYQNFVGNYVNYAIGHPAYRSAEGAQRIGSMLRQGEFIRTIVGNVTSPIYNSFQRILPTAEVAVSSAAKAARDEMKWLRGNPEIMKIVRDAKIPLESLGPHKLDTEALTGGRLQKAMTYVADKGGIPFGFAERQNRVYSLLAGYHDKLRTGGTYEEALQAGRDMIQKTQFTPGPTDRPPWMRGELGSTIGQFKYFQTKLGEYVYNNFSDMFRKGATFEQRYEASKKFVKFWGISYALGGPQVMPVLGDWLEKHDPVQWKGALPALGMAVRDQLGLGTVLPKDIKSLMYQIPGPALTHAKDLLTALGYDPMDPTKIQDVASRTRAATRAIPLAGVALERLRRGGIVNAQGEEREPQTLGEAIPPYLGGTPIPSSRPLLARGVSRIGRSIGVQDPEMQESFDLMSELNRAGTIVNKAKADAAQALAVGDRATADRILRQAERDLKLPPGRLKVSSQSRKAQKNAAGMTPLERRRKALGKDLRDYGMEDTLP